MFEALHVLTGESRRRSPVLDVPDTLPQPLDGPVRGSGTGGRHDAVFIEEGSGRERVPSQPVRIVDRIDGEDQAVTLQDPVPSSDVVFQGLAQSRSRVEPKRPERVDALNGTVEVTAGTSVFVRPGWEQDPYLIGDQIEDVLHVAEWERGERAHARPARGASDALAGGSGFIIANLRTVEKVSTEASR